VIDLIIVLVYFIAVMGIAMSGRLKKDISSEDYFLSGRNLSGLRLPCRPSLPNIQGFQYMGFMGSAYLYGFAQA